MSLGGSGFRPCANHLAGEKMGEGGSPSILMPIFSSGGGQNLDILSRFRKSALL